MRTLKLRRQAVKTALEVLNSKFAELTEEVEEQQAAQELIRILNTKLAEECEDRKADQVMLQGLNTKLEESIIEHGLTEDALRANKTELQISQDRKLALINAIPDRIYIINRDGAISFYKAGNERINDGSGQLLGKSVFDGLSEDIATITRQNIERAFEFDQVQVFEYSLTSNGNIQHYEARIAVSSADEVMVICRNITERKFIEEQLKYQRLYDSLTDLYNRTFFEEQMKRCQDMRNNTVGLIICDVDGLKIVNDALGHHIGDVILKNVAKILKDSFRPEDIVARIGGDEFSVLLTDSSIKSLEGACHCIRERILSYNIDNPTIPISLSLGYAVNQGTAIDTNALFKEADNNMYREKLHRKKSARSSIVQALMKALEVRDFITEGHGDRVQMLVENLAIAIGLPEQSRADLILLSRFHDIGKVGIPDSILFKPSPLIEEEWVIMRKHCEIGYRIAMAAPDLVPIADWVLKHQEWWNGNGYPLRIAGEEIPVPCRILAIADAYDAMTNDRPYRQAMPQQAAIAELTTFAGTQFDPTLVAVFVGMLEAEAAPNIS